MPGLTPERPWSCFRAATLLHGAVLLLLALPAIAQPVPRAYVTTFGSNPAVAVIDTLNNKVRASVPLSTGGAFAAVVSPDGAFVYISTSYSGPVTVLNTRTNRVVAEIPVPHTSGLAITPDGAFLYVAAGQPHREVFVVNTATRTMVRTIRVGSSPTGVAVTPDGKQVYVTNADSHNLSVIDKASNRVVNTIALNFDSMPQRVAITPDGGRAYVTNWANSFSGADTLSVVDIATQRVIASPHVSIFQWDIAITPDGSRAYVTDASSTVYVIATVTNTVTDLISVGSSPLGIAITPDGSRAYVANNGTYSDPQTTVSVIDLATNHVVETIQVQDRAAAVAIRR